jgi:hypothetical protein
MSKIPKKHQSKSSKDKKDSCIELKITHVLPKYEDLKSTSESIYDGKVLTVWKDKENVHFWLASTIAIFPLEEWDEIKKELMAMFFADKGKIYDDNPE